MLDGPQDLALLLEAAIRIAARELNFEATLISLEDLGRKIETGDAQQESKALLGRLGLGTGRHREALRGAPRALGKNHKPSLVGRRRLEPGRFAPGTLLNPPTLFGAGRMPLSRLRPPFATLPLWRWPTIVRGPGLDRPDCGWRSHYRRSH
jgi:hypothetical protein